MTDPEIGVLIKNITEGPPEAMPGEARQAFKAVAALPPLAYARPDPDTEPTCQPRESLPREDLLALPLLHNPILDAHPARRRATPAEEQEMLRWASHGLTRVRHVLHDTGTRVLTFAELAARHPALAGTPQERDRVRHMHESIFFTAAVWCVPALRVPLVHSLIRPLSPKKKTENRHCGVRTDAHARDAASLSVVSVC